MFSGPLIGFLAAVSAFAWTYSVFSRRTGGNNRSSLTASSVVAVIVFVIVVTIMATIDSMV